LREKSQDFFGILQYDRSYWYKFWQVYCRENAVFMDGYNKTLDLDETRVQSILNDFSRPFLDGIKQKNEQIKHLKERSAKILNSHYRELELSKEDFVIYLIGALGLQDKVEFLGEEGGIILIDIVSLFKHNRIEQLQDIVLDSAKRFRENREQNKQEGI